MSRLESFFVEGRLQHLLLESNNSPADPFITILLKDSQNKYLIRLKILEQSTLWIGYLLLKFLVD